MRLFPEARIRTGAGKNRSARTHREFHPGRPVGAALADKKRRQPEQTILVRFALRAHSRHARFWVTHSQIFLRAGAAHDVEIEAETEFGEDRSSNKTKSGGARSGSVRFSTSWSKSRRARHADLARADAQQMRQGRKAVEGERRGDEFRRAKLQAPRFERCRDARRAARAMSPARGFRPGDRLPRARASALNEPKMTAMLTGHQFDE